MDCSKKERMKRWKTRSNRLDRK